jgi:hypothetical protein
MSAVIAGKNSLRSLPWRGNGDEGNRGKILVTGDR